MLRCNTIVMDLTPNCRWHPSEKSLTGPETLSLILVLVKTSRLNNVLCSPFSQFGEVKHAHLSAIIISTSKCSILYRQKFRLRWLRWLFLSDHFSAFPPLFQWNLKRQQACRSLLCRAEFLLSEKLQGLSLSDLTSYRSFPSHLFRELLARSDLRKTSTT